MNDTDRLAAAMAVAKRILALYANPRRHDEVDEEAVAALTLKMLRPLVHDDFGFPLDALGVEVAAHRLVLWRLFRTDDEFSAIRRQEEASIKARADALSRKPRYY